MILMHFGNILCFFAFSLSLPVPSCYNPIESNPAATPFPRIFPRNRIAGPVIS